MPQYYPLVHSIFWIEYHLWGLWTPGYHVVNVLLHAAAAVLLWRLLLRLAAPGAWLAAAIFVVHPVEVETAAWITEQKNTLSAVFALLSMLAYLRFSPPEKPATDTSPGERPDWRFYTLALVCYVLALWSKTVTASVPAVLLVIYWWKRGAITRRDWALLAPFFVIGLALASITVRMERTNVGAEGMPWNLGLAGRMLVGGRALWFYAGELLWPVDLSFFYPRWNIEPGRPWQYFYPAAVVAVLAGLWAARKRVGRGTLAAVLIFAGVLTPALGFFNVYPFRYSYVADHFQYHASMALIALAVAGAITAWKQLSPRQGNLGTAVGICVLGVLGYLAFERTRVYQNQFTLFKDVLERDPQSWIGHNNLGTLYLSAGDLPKAMEHLSIAMRLNPQYLEAHNAMASALAAIGDYRAAMKLLDQTLATPDAPPSHVALTSNNLAWNLAVCPDERMRDPARAVELARRAVELSPKTGAYYSTLGVALYRASDDRGAIEALEKSIKLRAGGGDSSDRYFLAMAYHRPGEQDAANRWYAEALARAKNETPTAESQRFAKEAERVLGKSSDESK